LLVTHAPAYWYGAVLAVDFDIALFRVVVILVTAGLLPAEPDEGNVPGNHVYHAQVQ